MTRKDFLLKSLGLAGAAVAGAALLSSCGNEQKAACDSSEGLPAGEVQKRQAAQYVSISAMAGKNCNNCLFFQAPAAGAECGGCQLFAGGVRPSGYCTTWAQKVA